MSLRTWGSVTSPAFKTQRKDASRYQKCLFSSSPFNRASSTKQTHYDILEIATTASQAEIKKKFYALSLKHHPDRNPKDPEAATRFTSISTAYSTLSDPNKRARYDRDNSISNHDPHHQHPHHGHGRTSNPHPTHRGSYVGSRPASGLSKRRSTFKGPPPSFYAHGGYASNSHRTSGPSPSHPDPTQSSSFNDSSIPHFNPHITLRAQRAEDERRRHRARSASEKAMRARGWSQEAFETDREESTLGRFLLVSGLFAIMGTGGSWWAFHQR